VEYHWKKVDIPVGKDGISSGIDGKPGINVGISGKSKVKQASFIYYVFS